jgi:4-amino-4-deoxy-L-arabinose transferase-like glycosyltransferase
MRTRKFAWLLWIAIGALAVGLRIYSLDADPDWRLDWNPGLLTDEAFYMHNARNQVLFGQAHLDEFNNAVISPLVHWLHVVVFSWFGVGYVQGRWVSVVLGLLGVVLLGRVLWLAFQGAGDVNRAVPAAGLLALGGMFYLAYEHLYLLYNRTALLETPAAFFCLASLWCFAEACACRRRLGAWLWGLLAGGVAVLALATKLTTMPFVAALLLGAFLSRRSDGPTRLTGLTGLLSGVCCWGCWWAVRFGMLCGCTPTGRHGVICSVFMRGCKVCLIAGGRRGARYTTR